MNYDSKSETQVGDGTKAHQLKQHEHWVKWVQEFLTPEEQIGWDYKLLFITLTFRNINGEPPSLTFARRARTKYIEFIRENCFQVIKLFVAEERGKADSNRLHYHWLMLCRTNVSQRKFKPFGQLADTLKNGWTYGTIKDAKIVENPEGAVAYVTKYVCKDGGDAVFEDFQIDGQLV